MRASQVACNDNLKGLALVDDAVVAPELCGPLVRPENKGAVHVGRRGIAVLVEGGALRADNGCAAHLCVQRPIFPDCSLIALDFVIEEGPQAPLACELSKFFADDGCSPLGGLECT